MDLLKLTLIPANAISEEAQESLLKTLTIVAQSMSSECDTDLLQFILTGNSISLLGKKLETVKVDNFQGSSLHIIKLLQLLRTLTSSLTVNEEEDKHIYKNHAWNNDYAKSISPIVLTLAHTSMFGLGSLLSNLSVAVEQSNQQSLATIAELSLSIVNSCLKLDLLGTQEILNHYDDFTDSVNRIHSILRQRNHQHENEFHI